MTSATSAQYASNRLLNWDLPKKIDPDMLNQKMDQAQSLAADIDNVDGVDLNCIPEMVEVELQYPGDESFKKLKIDQRNPDQLKLSLQEQSVGFGGITGGRLITMERGKHGGASIMQTDYILLDDGQKTCIVDKNFHRGGS